MCGRIVREGTDDYPAFFGLVESSEANVQPRFNIAPTQMDLIIRAEEDGRHLEESRWGLIPVWAKEPGIGSRMFNARSETLMEKASFKSLVKNRRCIIPASGFYEWQKTPSGKQPLYIYRTDNEPLAFAGLYTFWKDPATEVWVMSHTIMTCGPNEFMAPIHSRMPVILASEALDAWLDPDAGEVADVLGLLQPCPDGWLTCHPVSTLVNSTRNDSPQLAEPN
jgi:putative SOS response-associated peptidase YedK